MTITEYLTLIPVLGDTVRATDDGYVAKGRIGTIQSDDSRSDPDVPYYVRFPAVDSEPAVEYWVRPGAVELVTAATETPLDYKALYEAQVHINEQFRQSIEIISDRMVWEATNRGWCSEFSRIIEEVNELLPLYKLSQCGEEYTVGWYETYIVKVRRTGTWTGVNPDVDRIARGLNGEDDATSSQILDAVRNGDYTCGEYVSGSAEMDNE